MSNVYQNSVREEGGEQLRAMTGTDLQSEGTVCRSVFKNEPQAKINT